VNPAVEANASTPPQISSVDFRSMSSYAGSGLGTGGGDMRRKVMIGLAIVTLVGASHTGMSGASAAPTVVPSQLSDVACPTASNCFAVGISETKPSSHVRSLVERWNGTKWSLMASPSASTGNTWLSGVVCTSSTSCIAVGNSSPSGYGGKPYAVQLAGGKWSAMTMPTAGPQALLNDITCTGGKNCFAVGQYYKNGIGLQPLALRWNGTKWSAVPAALPPGLRGARLRGVECASATKCFAVGGTDDFEGGNVALVERWTGSRWAVAQTFSIKGGIEPKLSDISCPTATRCTAVGDDDTAYARTLAATWNGQSWKAEAPKSHTAGFPLNSLQGVSCWAAGTCMAVGSWMESSSGPTHTLTERRSGSGWSIVASPNKHPTDTLLQGVDCTSAKHCVAVGSSSAASPVVTMVWNGTTWKNVKPA
jgi:hypothetical protein